MGIVRFLFVITVLLELYKMVRITGSADRSLRATSIQMTKAVMDLDPSRLVTCASGWTDQPVGHVLDVHVYPGPTNGGTGNITLYSGSTNEEMQHSMPIQNRPNGGTGNIPLYS
jgi:hypothetical protein